MTIYSNLTYVVRIQKLEINSETFFILWSSRAPIAVKFWTQKNEDCDRNLEWFLKLLKCLKNSSNSYSFYLLFLYLPPASKPPIFFQESDKITIIANYLQNSFFYPSIEFIIPPIHLLQLNSSFLI